jgi:hypothetical protein
MRIRWTAVLLLAAGCTISGSGPIRGPFTAHAAREREVARAISPGELVLPDAPPPRSTGTFKVRAWVDEDYRRRPRWRSTVEELVARVSRYTAAAFGAALEVEVRPWERSGDVPLGAIHDELIALDPGADVDWVVGFVTAPQALTTDLDHLGVATPLGKHILIRDMNDADEARAIDQAFPDLGADERVAFYAERKRHKELVVFLHEWAHTLGHPHDADLRHVMGPSYTPHAAVFSPEGTRLVRAALVARRGGPGADAAVGEMRRLLETNAGGWPSARERADVLLALGAPDERWSDQVLEALADGAVTRAEALLGQRPNDARQAELGAQLLRIRRQTGLAPDVRTSGVDPRDEPAVRAAFVAIFHELGRDLPEARRQLAAATRRFPRALPFEVARCLIEGTAGNRPEARKACRAALARWDDLPFAHFWAGQVADKEADAIAHQRRAIELDAAQEGPWTVLATLYAKRHDARALDELRQRYRAQFGKELR